YLLRVVEGTIDLIGLVEAEVPGKSMAKGHFGVDLHMMTDSACHSIAGQRPIFRVPLLLRGDGTIGDGIKHGTGKQLAVFGRLGSAQAEEPGLTAALALLAQLVETELPLPHHAVTVQAEILDDLVLLLVHSAFCFELREKDRVTAEQAPGRRAPLPEGRQVAERHP